VDHDGTPVGVAQVTEVEAVGREAQRGGPVALDEQRRHVADVVAVRLGWVGLEVAARRHEAWALALADSVNVEAVEAGLLAAHADANVDRRGRRGGRQVGDADLGAVALAQRDGQRPRAIGLLSEHDRRDGAEQDERQEAGQE